MAGLAAALNVPDVIDAIAWALAPRGAEGAVCRLAGHGGADLAVTVRAAMPAIARVVAAGDDVRPDSRRGRDGTAGGPGSGDDPRPIAAIVVDGIASVTALDQGYAAQGPRGLIDGGMEPYAVILADAERDELVLARNGAGPGLYYARLASGWVVASEPGPLVQAGVAADPDVGVVRRFIGSGVCDDTERTFFARIRRVLPGEAVVLPAVGRAPARYDTGWAPGRVAGYVAVVEATAAPRLAVLLTPGLAGGAVVGASLCQPERHLPLSVHTAELAGAPRARPPALLAALPATMVTHTRHTVAAGRAELDEFLSEVGEPVPDIGYFLAWSVARDLPDGIETLVDAQAGSAAALDRVADRLLARHGVSLRSPVRREPGDGGADPPELLAALVERMLPPAAARRAAAEPDRSSRAAELVLALGDEVAAALVTPRPWDHPAASLSVLRRLHKGEDVDGEALLRAYLVERWLAGQWPQATSTATAPARTAAAGDGRPRSVTVGGETWLRLPVWTPRIQPGEPVEGSVGCYVANALAELRRDPTYVDCPAGPWFVVVSGKAVAVNQGRITPVLDVRPGWPARLIARWARRRLPSLAEACTAQVAVDHSGLMTVATSVVLGRPREPRDAVYPPRPEAVVPADAAVVRAPFQPDDVAAAVLAGLRYALPADLSATLAGGAVASVDDNGCRVLGFASGPGPEGPAGDAPEGLLTAALADNPWGQGGEQTPVVVLMRAPVGTTRRTGRDYASLDRGANPPAGGERAPIEGTEALVDL